MVYRGLSLKKLPIFIGFLGGTNFKTNEHFHLPSPFPIFHPLNACCIESRGSRCSGDGWQSLEDLELRQQNV